MSIGWRRLLAVGMAAAALLWILGCGDSGGGDSPQLREPVCEVGLITRRFGLRWKNLNHRVSYLRATHSEAAAECSETTLSWQADALLGQIGGDFTTGEGVMSDVPLYDFEVWPVSDPYLTFEHVQAEFVIEQDPETHSTVHRTIQVDLAGHPLADAEEITALVRGVTIDTNIEQAEDYPEDYNPAHGYVTRGFGAAIESVERVSDEAGERLLIQVMLRIEFAPGADRPDMGRAIPRSRTAGTLFVTLIGVDQGALHRGEIDYRLEYDWAPPYSPQPPADEALQRLNISGEPDLPAAYTGLRAFNIVLDPAEGYHGYYVLETSVAIERMEYDPASGIASAWVNGYASNGGIFEFFALNHEFSATVELIQTPWTGPAGPPARVEAEGPLGDAVFPLSGEIERQPSASAP